MARVILFGEPMALLTADVPGPLENIVHFSRSMSGAEVNVAVGLSRLGHEVHYLSRVGDDPFGHYIQNELQAGGIVTDLITFDPVYRTGIQLKNRVEDGSDPFAPYYRRGPAASRICAADIEQLQLDHTDLIHVTGIPPALSDQAREATYALMRRARAEGIFVTFDPNLRPALWESEEAMISTLNELASLADLVLPGMSECRLLAKAETVQEAAGFYHSLGVPTVIIKDGSKGAWISTGSSMELVQGFPVRKVVDTVGAGDGFAVGVISALLEKQSLKDAVRRGNAIGAMQVMTVGDNEGLPDRNKLEEFMNSYRRPPLKRETVRNAFELVRFTGQLVPVL